MQQWPQADIELNLLGLEHVVRLAPVGVGQLDVVEMHMRGPAPVDRNARDLGLAARNGVGVLLDLSPDEVGCHEDIGRQACQTDEQDQDTDRPADDLEQPPHNRDKTSLRRQGSLARL